MHHPSFTGAAALLLGALGCSSNDAPPGSISVQISGEEAATDGFLYPTGSEVTFTDGWELHFSHVLVTIDELSLAENPDKAPADQSQTDAVVARAMGPWAVDLAQGGSVPAVGGEGLAVPLTTIPNENQRDGADFALDQRYAFGYRIVAARDDARRVNFPGDDATENLYSKMVARGYAVLYVGVATFEGESCAASDDAYDFGALPHEVPFELGFATPTTYVNCQNQENQGDPFQGEEYQRGVALTSNRASIAQITLHVEHPFFSSTVHDSAVYFDQMAAQLVGTEADRVLASEDFVGVDPTAFTDGAGDALPWRSCLPEQPSPSDAQRGFGVGHVLVDRKGDPRQVFRDYRDFVNYIQSTQGHLNGGEGLCYVQRDYPSPR